MHPLLYLMLIAGGALAHYRGGYETRNLIEREEPENELEGFEIVECPVCGNTNTWPPNHEECPIERGGKRFKQCKYGVYNNSACGNRRDCYRGPREGCTEKMKYDLYDQRCASGYYCNPAMGACTGIGYVVDSNVQWLVNPNRRYHFSSNERYPIRASREV